MSNESQSQSGAAAISQGRRRSTVLPEGYSWLSVPLPTAALDHLHIQARRSAMPFRQYVQIWAMDAFPYNPEAGSVTAPEPAPAPVS